MFNKVEIYLPGGCDIGKRPIDQHIKGLNALNVDLCISKNILRASCNQIEGKEINLDDIKVIQNTNKFSGRHYIFEECESRIDIADKLDVDEKDLRLLISRDEDWYVLSAETDNSINIYDYLKILNEEKLYKKSNLEQKIAGLEMASNMYELFIEADKKNKSIIMQTQNDNLGIDFEVLVQNGIIKIDEQGRAKNITVIDRQRLQEETDKIKEILEKQEELLISLEDTFLQNT